MQVEIRNWGGIPAVGFGLGAGIRQQGSVLTTVPSQTSHLRKTPHGIEGTASASIQLYLTQERWILESAVNKVAVDGGQPLLSASKCIFGAVVLFSRDWSFTMNGTY